MFQIGIIETPSLGDRSYLVHDGAVAAVIDPQRDIDRIQQVADEHRVRITHVLETHLHNDYVSGGLALAGALGAAYVVSAEETVAFDRQPVRDGDLLHIGRMRLRTLATPGHTHHHVAYALENAGGDVQAVFTGGSLLFGATGRTDLVSPADTDRLTRAQYHSVRRLAAELPSAAQVMPTHGFGSFCSATPTSGNASTLAEQQQVNPALTQSEQAFLEELIAGLDAYPAYYTHMMPANSAGAAGPQLSMPQPVDVDQVRARVAAGEWVVDLRKQTVFAEGHLAGTASFELSDSFVTYLGWLHPWQAPLTLIGESPEQVLAARRELTRIGVDRVDGAFVGDPAANAPPAEVRSYPVGDFAGLAARITQSEVIVLDTRRNDERKQAAIPRSLHIPLHELTGRLDEVPEKEVWVHCGSGYRAGIATSLLDNGKRRVVHINDAFDHAIDLNLTTTFGSDTPR